MNTLNDKIINMKKIYMEHKLRASFNHIASNSVPEICDGCEFSTQWWKYVATDIGHIIGHKRMCECALLQDIIDGDNPQCAVYDFVKFMMERI